MNKTTSSGSVKSLLGILAVILFVSVSMTMQSCATAKLPSQVTESINKLSTDIPRLLGQASNPYNAQFGEQAKNLLALVDDTARMAGSNKKFKKVTEQLNDLSKNKLMPYFDNWKVKGQLDPNTIAAGIRGANDAMMGIKKAAKM